MVSLRMTLMSDPFQSSSPLSSNMTLRGFVSDSWGFLYPWPVPLWLTAGGGRDGVTWI